MALESVSVGCARCAWITDGMLRAARVVPKTVRVGQVEVSAEGGVWPVELSERLPATERRLVVALVLMAPDPASHRRLWDAGWDHQIFGDHTDLHLLRVNISRVRAKLEPWGLAVSVVKGYGYRIVEV